MNARSESVEQKLSFGRAWKNLQLALIPRISFFETDYETGNTVQWKIGTASDDPLAFAGLWRQRKEADGSLSLAFTMLTVNSDEHPLRKAQRYRDKFGKPVAWRQRNPIPMRYDSGRRNESSPYHWRLRMKKLAAALITSLFATVAFAQTSAPAATAPAATATAPATTTTTPAPAHKTTKHIHKVSHHVTHKKAVQ
jgi:hypothetical protein